MERKKRFFLFFSSAGLMTVFIIFTLSFRDDNPLEAWLGWLPERRVLTMVNEHVLADGKRKPKAIEYSPIAECALKAYNLSPLEISHALKKGDVFFRHDSTFVQEKPKKYVLEIEVDFQPYFVQVHIERAYTLVNYLSKREDLKFECSLRQAQGDAR